MLHHYDAYCSYMPTGTTCLLGYNCTLVPMYLCAFDAYMRMVPMMPKMRIVPNSLWCLHAFVPVLPMLAVLPICYLQSLCIYTDYAPNVSTLHIPALQSCIHL